MGKAPQGPDTKTQKQLFAHSGNRCAFAGCDEHLVKDGVVVGQICHITAASPLGPRYDAEQSDADRHSSSNLILLCANHHKIIDEDPAKYTVEHLVRMKADHEGGKNTISHANVDKILRTQGQSFMITNNFHGPVNAIAQGNASIGSASQTVSGSHVQVRPLLEITVGESGRYFNTKSAHLYNIQRTFLVRIENLDQSKTVHGCKLHLLSITPGEGYQGPWVLEEGFSLAAGDHKFIPFVSYGEARNPKTYNCADSFMEVLPAVLGRPTMDKSGVHGLSMRITGIDAPPVDLKCQVWVDDDGRLRVAETPSEIWLSLRDAARRAYEHTRGTDLADMAERHDGTPEGLLEYYSVLIVEYYLIFVKRPPSNVPEPYPRELWSKMQICNQLNGIKYYGAEQPIYTEPAILEPEFARFIEWTNQYRQAKPN